LIVENEVEKEFVNVLSRNLKVDLSNICLFRFKNKIKKNEDCENCITVKDFGFFGKLTNESIKRTIEKPFDLVINLTTNNEYVSSIVANSKTEFKTGLLDEFSQVYDLTINVESGNLSAFNEELKKYLEILKKL